MPCTICSQDANLTICQSCSLMFCERCIQDDQHTCDRTQSMATNSNPNSTNHSASTSSSSSSNQNTTNSTNSPTESSTNPQLIAAQVHYRYQTMKKFSTVTLDPYSEFLFNCSNRKCCKQNNGKLKGVKVTERGKTSRHNETPIREAFTTSNGAGDEIRKQQTEQANEKLKSSGLSKLPSWVKVIDITSQHPSDSTTTSLLAKDIATETYEPAETRCIHCCEATTIWPDGRPKFNDTRYEYGMYSCCKLRAGYFVTKKRDAQNKIVKTISRDDGKPCLLLEEWKKNKCPTCLAISHDAAKRCGTERCNKHCDQSNRKELQFERWPKPLEVSYSPPITNDGLIRQSIRSDSTSGYFGVTADMRIQVENRTGNRWLGPYPSLEEAAVAFDKISIIRMQLHGSTSVDNIWIQAQIYKANREKGNTPFHLLNFTNSSAAPDPLTTSGDSITELLADFYKPNGVPVLPGTIVRHWNKTASCCFPNATAWHIFSKSRITCRRLNLYTLGGQFTKVRDVIS